MRLFIFFLNLNIAFNFFFCFVKMGVIILYDYLIQNLCFWKSYYKQFLNFSPEGIFSQSRRKNMLYNETY